MHAKCVQAKSITDGTVQGLVGVLQNKSITSEQNAVVKETKSVQQ